MWCRKIIIRAVLTGFFACLSILVIAGGEGLPIILEKIDFFLQKGNSANAREWLLKAKQIDPKNPDVLALDRKFRETVDAKVQEYLKNAETYADSKDIPKAIEAYRAILEIIPDHPIASRRLKEMKEIKMQVTNYQNQGITVSSPGGQGHFDLNAYSSTASLLKAHVAFDSGNLENSLNLVEIVLRTDPENPKAKELRGKIVQRQEFNDLVSGAAQKSTGGNFKQAEDYYDELILLQPNKAELYVNRGRARLRQKRFEPALNDFFKAISLGISFETLRQEIIDVMVGTHEYLKAYAVSDSGPQRKAIGVPTFRLWCIWNGYRYSCLFLLLSLAIFLWAVLWISDSFGNLLEKGRWYTLQKMARCLIQCALNEPETQVEELHKIAKILNLPWLHYITGLIFFSIEKFDPAHEHLQQAVMSSSLAPRGYFFLGVIRRKKQESLAHYDFEQTIVKSLSPHQSPWLPGFVANLEKKMLEKYQHIPEEDSLMKLSWQTVKFITE